MKNYLKYKLFEAILNKCLNILTAVRELHKIKYAMDTSSNSTYRLNWETFWKKINSDLTVNEHELTYNSAHHFSNSEFVFWVWIASQDIFAKQKDNKNVSRSLKFKTLLAMQIWKLFKMGCNSNISQNDTH